MMAASSSAFPSWSSTSAVMASPKRSSGTPTTTASRTESWSLTASSTSSGYTFSPPVLMHTEPRPSSTSALAVDDHEGGRRFHRVLVVPDRLVAAHGDAPDLVAARHH